MFYPKKVYFKDLTFLVNEHVYEPAEDTFLIAEKMKINKNDIVLDMGTGCGILAVIAAKKTKNVIATDINPHAVRVSKKNAENNGVKEKIEFRNGDLFHAIKKNERFSVILFNSPYLPSVPGEEKTWIGKAWSGGQNGRQVIDRFISDSTRFLLTQGKILLVQSSLSNINRTLEMFNKLNLKAEIVAQIKFPFEKIVLIEAK
ncbi:tRNA (adenine(22)-N(1))-methyltransferase TrmK [Candidatus Bathyarchaeota archaeon]|nr:tRNA (adenine(22)-N(1))-methyltransferase TrmK [Candidatus Bathyarchaeota archaeon]